MPALRAYAMLGLEVIKIMQLCTKCNHTVLEVFIPTTNGGAPHCESCYKQFIVMPLKVEYEAKTKELSAIGDRLKRSLEWLARATVNSSPSAMVTCQCAKRFVNGLAYAQHLDDCEGPPKDSTPRARAVKSTEFDPDNLW